LHLKQVHSPLSCFLNPPCPQKTHPQARTAGLSQARTV
jgi:hypothetical protein